MASKTLVAGAQLPEGACLVESRPSTSPAVRRMIMITIIMIAIIMIIIRQVMIMMIIITLLLVIINHDKHKIESAESASPRRTGVEAERGEAYPEETQTMNIYIYIYIYM